MSARASAEEHLITALVRGDAAGVTRWHAAATTDRLVQALARQRLTALLGGRLLEVVGDAADAQLRHAVEETTAVTRLRGTMQLLAGDSALEALRAAGVAAAWIKGPHLARYAHGDLGLRASSDIDLLVDVSDLRAAVEVVRRLGWSSPQDWTDARGRPLLHFRLQHPAGLPPLELHWRVHWYEEDLARDVLARGASADDGVDLQAADRLALLLLCYARDGLAGVRLVCDVAALLERHRVEDGAVQALADRHPQLRPSLLSAAHAVNACLGRAHGALAVRLDSLPARARMGRRVANPMLRLDDKQIIVESALMDVLLAPPGQAVSALRRQVTLSSGLHGIADEAGRAAASRRGLDHAGRQLRRFAMAPLLRLRTPTADVGD